MVLLTVGRSTQWTARPMIEWIVSVTVVTTSCEPRVSQPGRDDDESGNGVGDGFPSPWVGGRAR